ncbi:MAG: 4'-phosphopantetheinyl transferase superfamily protein [Oscillospiraceae bacterium]|nr:4'-phosphopantetheinyl transferase superfamily protein [Oscillospiraceae bacterium]MBQ7088143.1 4'-phosphopantetheinyl transferase superfamily protein [Clostridia bacterium]
MELFFYPDITEKADAYALLAYAVQKVYSLDSLPAISRTEHGKPFFPDHPQLQFNLSHSGRFALCALDDFPVGVDIECVRPHHPRLAQRICSPAELEWINVQADPQRALLSLWTKKEARVKQDGCGLTIPLREISVSFDEDADWDGLHFCSLYGHGWVGAVCGHSSPTALHTVTADRLKKLDTTNHKC